MSIEIFCMTISTTHEILGLKLFIFVVAVVVGKLIQN